MNSPYVSTMSVLRCGGTEGDDLIDSHPDFLGLGANVLGKMSSSTWSDTQKNFISIDLARCFFTVLFAIPVAVALSQCTGVGGCG